MTDNPLYILMSLPEFVRDSRSEYQKGKDGPKLVADLIADGLIVYLGNGDAKLTELGRKAAKDPSYTVEYKGRTIRFQEISDLFLSGRKLS